MKRWLRPIKKMGACKEALVWAGNYDSLKDAWQACARGDWMLWLLGELYGEPGSEARKKLVIVCCSCARLALPYVGKNELRPLKAIETAEKWAKGDGTITLEDVRNAASAAASAASAAPAASAAAYAALAAASAAAYAAYATAYAAYAARVKGEGALKRCADIVRKYYAAPEL